MAMDKTYHYKCDFFASGVKFSARKSISYMFFEKSDYRFSRNISFF